MATVGGLVGLDELTEQDTRLGGRRYQGGNRSRSGIPVESKV